MPEQLIRISKVLLAAALADAADWQESLLAAHDPQLGAVISCCKPGARCGDYVHGAELLARYRGTQRRLRHTRRSRTRETDATERERL